MPAINFYFQIHQPYRLRRYTVFDLGQNSFYEDDDRNCDALLYAARTSYLPMNDLLLRCIHKHGKRFKVSFAISGIALEQFEQYTPEVIESFIALANTGCVEFLAVPYAHSLAFLYSKDEFARQVTAHSNKIFELFGQKTQVLCNTELIYNNDLGKMAEDMGFTAVIAEGTDPVLGWRSPNFVYAPENANNIKLLLRNYQLSEDICLRFSDQSWPQWPLTAEKFASWCHGLKGNADVVNLFMHYETFGLTHKAESGIFQFMEHLPDIILQDKAFTYATPSEAVTTCPAVGSVDIPVLLSWATAEKDLNMWLGNDMQEDAIQALYALEPNIARCANADLQQTWLRLQSIEHFAYMCTKWFSSKQDASRLANPYNSPYDAYINYMNVLADFTLNLNQSVADVVLPAHDVVDASHNTTTAAAVKTTTKRAATTPAKKTTSKSTKDASTPAKTAKAKTTKTSKKAAVPSEDEHDGAEKNTKTASKKSSVKTTTTKKTKANTAKK